MRLPDKYRNYTDMARYTKGMSGNPTGKPRGAKNRTTEQVRKLLQSFIEGKLPELETIWKGLDPKDKISFIDRLLKHVLPAPINSIEQFSEDDLDYLLSKLKAKQHETSKN